MRPCVPAAVAASLLLLFAAPSPAAPINPTALQVGQVGKMPTLIPGYYEVEAVGKTEIAVFAHYSGQDYPTFIVKGLDTSKYADGSKIEFTGTFEVTGTTKRGSRTFFVVEKKD